MATSPNPSLQEAVPIVDRERLEAVYDELKRMLVKLDPNPIEYGPVRFQNRIAQVRSVLTRIEQIFLQASEDLHWYVRATRAKRLVYNLERRELMVNDPKCRMGRSQGEREALADVKLRTEIEDIEDLASRAEDLEILMVVIKSKRTDLKDIQGRMRDQMKLIEHDLGMGARWGKTAPHIDTDSAVEDINTLLAAVGSEPEAFIEDETTEEVVEEVAEDEEVVVEDDHDDPAPVAGKVIEFVVPPDDEDETDTTIVAADDGSEDPSYDETPDEDTVIPEEDAQGELPADEHTSSEADEFLDALDPEPEEPEPEPEADDGSIEDLISSLADD